MHRPIRVARWVAIGVGIAYAVALHLSGVHLTSALTKVVGYAPTAVVVLVVAFDLWAWRWPGINQLVDRPVLAGTWLGTLRPTAESHIPEGGNRGPIDAAIIIEQTYWSITVALLTAESRSASTSAAIRSNNESKQHRILAYTYANIPRQQVRHRSQPHIGATQLDIPGRAPDSLTGSYWTDRLTVGDIEVRRIDTATDYGSLEDIITAAQSSNP